MCIRDSYTTYIKGLREWDTLRAFYPDANLTLRVAYGHVGGYESVSYTHLGNGTGTKTHEN